MGVFKRGNKLWLTFKNAKCVWQNASTRLSVGKEEQAQAMYEGVFAEVARATGPTRRSSRSRSR